MACRVMVVEAGMNVRCVRRARVMRRVVRRRVACGVAWRSVVEVVTRVRSVPPASAQNTNQLSPMTIVQNA